MDWKKLACMMAIAGLTAVGCGDDDGTGDDMPDDVIDDTPLDCGDCFFVASELAIGVENDAGQVPGFNLDDRDSDETDDLGCNQPDWVSPEGVPGIDNQLATLAPTLEAALGADLEETVTGAVQDGSIIVLMDLEGVETVDDDTATLTLHIGGLPAGVDAPELNGDALAAGQTFTIETTVVTGQAIMIRGSVMMVAVDNLPLSIPFDESTTIDLNIRTARVRATIGADTLSNGLIGGSLNIDELVTTVMNVAPDIDPSLIQTTLEGVADLNQDADGVCQNVSVGITFEAVAAMPES